MAKLIGYDEGNDESSTALEWSVTHSPQSAQASKIRNTSERGKKGDQLKVGKR